MKYLLIFMFPLCCFAKNFKFLDKQIQQNNKHIPTEYRHQLIIELMRASNLHKVPSSLMAAIYMQESAYKLTAMNCSLTKCHDYGISQINNITIKHYKFDKEKLISDLRYSVEAGAIVLKDLKRRFSKFDKTWWSRYNAKDPVKRQEYEEKVLRYYK